MRYLDIEKKEKENRWKYLAILLLLLLAIKLTYAIIIAFSDGKIECLNYGKYSNCGAVNSLVEMIRVMFGLN